ncbi:MAG: DnaJ domain-containing protein [Myxococcales bacterium]|nr:DnaJ domain-containing protein [Myxococcales bacterium]
MSDPYLILGVARDASPEEIKRAFRERAFECHPDRHPDDPAKEEQFKELVGAYERAMARLLERGVVSAEELAPSNALGGLFTGLGRFVKKAADVAMGRRGRDIYLSVSVPFTEACRGSTRRLSHTVKDPQSGAEVKRQVTFSVPAGIRSGAVIKLPGEGGLGWPGAADGELHLTVTITPHPLLTRIDKDILTIVPVSAFDALLGTTIAVPTLDGVRRIKLRPATPNGHEIVFSGMGIKSEDGDGDQRVQIRLETPQKLSPEIIEQISVLAGTLADENAPKSAAFARKVRELLDQERSK